MQNVDSSEPFEFSVQNVLALASTFDSFNLRHPATLRLGTGLVGMEIWKFANALKRELLGEEAPRRRATDTPTPEVLSLRQRVAELENELALTRLSMVANTIAAVAVKKAAETA